MQTAAYGYVYYIVCTYHMNMVNLQANMKAELEKQKKVTAQLKVVKLSIYSYKLNIVPVLWFFP